MVRTPPEVFEHLGEALEAEDLDDIISQYSDDAVFMTAEGVRRGKAGVREAYAKLIADIPSASGAADADLRTRRFAGRMEGRIEKDKGRGWGRHVRIPRRTRPRAHSSLHADVSKPISVMRSPLSEAASRVGEERREIPVTRVAEAQPQQRCRRLSPRRKAGGRLRADIPRGDRATSRGHIANDQLGHTMHVNAPEWTHGLKDRQAALAAARQMLQLDIAEGDDHLQRLGLESKPHRRRHRAPVPTVGGEHGRRRPFQARTGSREGIVVHATEPSRLSRTGPRSGGAPNAYLLVS